MGTPGPRPCSRVAKPSVSEARESARESTHPRRDIPDSMDIRVYAVRLHWSSEPIGRVSLVPRSSTDLDSNGTRASGPKWARSRGLATPIRFPAASDPFATVIRSSTPAGGAASGPRLHTFVRRFPWIRGFRRAFRAPSIVSRVSSSAPPSETLRSDGAAFRAFRGEAECSTQSRP
jgi:hypothetical protein